MAWSTAIAFDRQAFTKAQPSTIADLLDTKKFPGKRALPAGPRYTLELALLADGVPPAEIYTTLATQAGADRAFAALDKIKPEIVWWDKAANPIDWLVDKKAAMAAGYSGRIFRAAILNRQRLDVIWDGQIYDLDMWAIPKAARNKDAAKRFIVFATGPAQMAAQASLIAYGPMRKSAIALVGKHPTLDIDMKSYLPTAPDNFKNALKFDEAWWDAHGDELGKRFQAWRTQPLPVTDTPTSSVPASGASGSAPVKPPEPNKPQKPRADRNVPPVNPLPPD
jgi:putative spermidine/putrescine transport system substrate-binding protein